MTSYKFGDIVLVPFPFTDQTINKKRPAIIISSEAYNQEHADIIIMAITSQVSAKSRLGEVTIREWKEAGLLLPSIIKPIIATIEKNLILQKLGQLKDSDRQALKQALAIIIGE